MTRTTAGVELELLWAHRRRVVMGAPDPVDASLDARSDARYDDGRVEIEPDPRADTSYWNGAEE